MSLMYQVWIVQLGFLIGFIWLVLLSFLFFKERNFLKKLFPDQSTRDIRQKFRQLIEIVEEFDKRGNSFEKSLNSFKREGQKHFQKVVVSRYNPYNDTGGDQSFTAIFLDGKFNGLILTSLHSRAGTRIYAKVVIGGKSDLDLSKEEKQVLQKAMNEA